MLNPVSFHERLQEAQEARGTDRALMLIPRLSQMPLPMQRLDDPFLPFGKAIIAATRDLVCAYAFDLAAYLALGAAGAIALERTVAYAGTDDQTVTILHAPFVGSAYVEAAAAFNVDAVTLASLEDAPAYQAAGLGVFWMDRAGQLTLPGDTRSICLFGESALYAGRGDDFADQTRATLT